jgi:hypothetical protein
MTIVTLQAVGLCSHYSRTGDRAFRFALGLARKRHLQLNVFAFVQSPFEVYEPKGGPCALPRKEQERIAIEQDRRLREYYDLRLGDFLDVGFRVCEGCETTELRRCLRRHEFEVLVIPYLGKGASFGNVPAEEFALHFMSPVVLVGDGNRRYHLNPQAELIVDKLGLAAGSWRPVSVLQEAGS